VEALALLKRALRRWHPNGRLDPNRFVAEVVLPGSAAVAAAAWFGSIPMPSAALAAANAVLSSIRVDRAYSCR
jgi:hypothetical protein